MTATRNDQNDEPLYSLKLAALDLVTGGLTVLVEGELWTAVAAPGGIRWRNGITATELSGAELHSRAPVYPAGWAPYVPHIKHIRLQAWRPDGDIAAGYMKWVVDTPLQLGFRYAEFDTEVEARTYAYQRGFRTNPAYVGAA